ncbi:MAG TPA: hypothetical protein VFQ35_02945 [Polyangiaceae bacterium]|nr:hypothetical protein [Polyangiaceae bacterium]
MISSRVVTNGSPFFDVTLGGLFLEQRFGDPLVVGIQGGAYFADIVRLSLRAEMPSSEATDQAGSSYDYQSSYTLQRVDADPARFIFGGTLGISVVNTQNFAFSPGVLVLRSDVADYGTVLGVSLPFEWITSRGLRFGLEVDLGRAFGGTTRIGCYSAGGCPPSEVGDKDREAGRALGLRFSIGYGIGFTRAR